MGTRSVDIIFLISFTDGMRDYLQALKHNIACLIDTLAASSGSTSYQVNWRAKVVGCRDGACEQRLLQDNPFTMVSAEFRCQLAGLEARGRSGESSSLLEAIYEIACQPQMVKGTTELDPWKWRYRSEAARVVFALTDAPCHPIIITRHGGTVVDVIDAIHRNRIIMTLIAPEDLCYFDLSKADRSEYYAIPRDSTSLFGIQRALIEYTAYGTAFLQSLEKVVLGSVSKSAYVPDLGLWPEDAQSEAAMQKARRDAEARHEAEATLALEQSCRVLGPTHPIGISAMAELACILEAQGKYDQAELLYRSSIEAAERTLGPIHTAIAECLGALAGILTTRGDSATADLLFRRADAIWQHTAGSSIKNADYDIRAACQGVERDNVDCTVYAPSEVVSGTSFLVQVYVHLLTKANEAQSLAQEVDSDTCRRGFTSLGSQVARGLTFTFELRLAGLAVEPSLQRIVWQGRTEYVQFPVTVPVTHPSSDVLGKLLVSQESIPIGQINFKLRVVSAHVRSDRFVKPTGCATRYTLAFISYASSDRPEVLRRIQMLPAVGIRYIQDVIDLDPGDRWAQKLFQYIDESDVMFLFWSSAAKDSEWVTKEWRYGLEKKGDAYVRPVVIEGPPTPKPPPELQHLHFADKVLYFITNTD